jgi:hypothetical protein
MTIASSLPVIEGIGFAMLRADFYGACSIVKSGGPIADRADAIVLASILWFWDSAIADLSGAGKSKVDPMNLWISPGNTAIATHCCGEHKPESIASCLRRLAARGFIKVQGVPGEPNKIHLCCRVINYAVTRWMRRPPEEPEYEPETEGGEMFLTPAEYEIVPIGGEVVLTPAACDPTPIAYELIPLFDIQAERAKRDREISRLLNSYDPEGSGEPGKMGAGLRRRLDDLEMDLDCTPAELVKHFKQALDTMAYGPDSEMWRNGRNPRFPFVFPSLAALLDPYTLFTLSSAWQPSYAKLAPKVWWERD